VLHIGGIYALTTAPSHPAVALLQQNTQAFVFAELRKNDLSPPVFPDFKPPPLVTVVPEIEINLSEVPVSATTPKKPASAAATTYAPTDIPPTPPVPITSHAVT